MINEEKLGGKCVIYSKIVLKMIQLIVRSKAFHFYVFKNRYLEFKR